MEDKAYSLQSPEYLAKEYGGNKQKIGQAAQMGLIDGTAAVLAGMFIDRMRAAALQEQAPPQQTVAQQVFTPPQPAAPPPPMPQGSMGAPPSPQGAPPQGGPPGMGAPPPPQGGPPGMAAGGLTTLPIPDQMFSEPAVDAESFAGGGIVSFAAGGDPYEERQAERDRIAAVIAERKASGYRTPQQELGADRRAAALDLLSGIEAPSVELPDVSGAVDYLTRGGPPPAPNGAKERLAARAQDRADTKSILAGRQAARKPTGPEPVKRRATDIASPLVPRTRVPEERMVPSRMGMVPGFQFGFGGRGRQTGEPKDTASARPAAATTTAPTRTSKRMTAEEVAALRANSDKNASAVAALGARGAFRDPTARPAPTSAPATARPRTAAGTPAPPRTGIDTLAQAAAAPPPAKTLQDTLTDVEKMQGDVSQGAAFKEQQAALAALRSPEGQKARKKEDLWASLAEIGFGIASGQSSNALTNISAGLAAALPGINSRNKERRTEQREALKDAVNAELAVYGMKVESAKMAGQIFKDANELNLRGVEMKNALKIAADRNLTDQRGQDMDFRARMAQIGASTAAAYRPSEDERLIAEYMRKVPGATYQQAFDAVRPSRASGSGLSTVRLPTPTTVSANMAAADKIINGGR